MTTTKSRTQLSSSLASYLKEIGATPLLTAKQEQVLATMIKKGDEQARQLMMKANLRLVVNIAKKYVPSNDPDILMDLIQDGNIGLMRAVDRFKPEFKTRFSTYGVYWIRQAILRALKSRRLVRLPENVVDRVLLLQRVRQRLYQVFGRQPTPDELAAEMKLPTSEIDNLEEASFDVISLDHLVRGNGGEGETELGDLLEDTVTPNPDLLAQTSLLQGAIRQAVTTLPPRERSIVESRFGLAGEPPMTLEEIGRARDISRERVRQLQNIAFSRLRSRERVQQAHQ